MVSGWGPLFKTKYSKKFCLQLSQKETIETFTPVQDKVYDIFTDVAAFMEWVNATTLNMGGLQTCKGEG